MTSTRIFLVLMLFLTVGILFNIEWTRFGLNDGSSRLESGLLESCWGAPYDARSEQGG